MYKIVNNNGKYKIKVETPVSDYLVHDIEVIAKHWNWAFDDVLVAMAEQGCEQEFKACKDMKR